VGKNLLKHRAGKKFGRQLSPKDPPSAPDRYGELTITASADTRLACQLRPTADIAITPLLPVDSAGGPRHVGSGLDGVERLITIMFVDMRGSTKLAEAKLPYDVLFILNRFLSEIAHAVGLTGGECVQFMGDCVFQAIVDGVSG
jgi:adenylate cyclase